MSGTAASLPIAALDPVLVGSGYRAQSSAAGVCVSGKIAYVADGTAGLHILDISNPAKPVRLAGWRPSNWAYSLRLQVVSNFLYMVDFSLHVFDVSNPSRPRRIGGHPTRAGAWGLHVVGNLAYVADGDAGMQIFDVKNPGRPTLIGGLETDGNAYDVQVSGNFAYLAAHGGGLQIIDIRQPAKPVLRLKFGPLGLFRFGFLAGRRFSAQRSHKLGSYFSASAQWME